MQGPRGGQRRTNAARIPGSIARTFSVAKISPITSRTPSSYDNVGTRAHTLPSSSAGGAAPQPEREAHTLDRLSQRRQPHHQHLVPGPAASLDERHQRIEVSRILCTGKQDTHRPTLTDVTSLPAVRLIVLG